MSSSLMTNTRTERGHRFVREIYWDLTKEQIDQLFASGLREDDYYESQTNHGIEEHEPDEGHQGATSGM